MKYDTIFLGGTFDCLHKGHKKLIKKAGAMSKSVVIGVTSDTYVLQNKKNAFIDSYTYRKKTIEEFLKKEDIQNVSIISINSALEPAASDLTYEAIIVSPDTKTGAERINKSRRQKQLKALDIIVVPIELGEDGKAISSTRIRDGEINREGKLYVKKDWNNKTIVISQKVRNALKEPGGKMIEDIHAFFKDSDLSKLVSVGDISTLTLNQQGSCHPISVVDFIVERKKMFSTFVELGFKGTETVIEVENKPGTINGILFEIAKKAITESKTNRVIIKITGEEDLVVLPFVLSCPLGWKIVYGQPLSGMIMLKVTEELKNRAFGLLAASKTIR